MVKQFDHLKAFIAEHGLPDWHDNKDAVAGTLICLGGMLYEWGLPLDKAIEGLKAAYAMEADKQQSDIQEPAK